MKKNKYRRKMSASDIVYLCVKILVFTVYGIISIFPMY